ncbi:MAG TPA: N-acetylneuraminate synthase [Rhizomicrobium sp.]|nr:N-acetylneuraminate synthase [Rhizomicrobium sp.]
MSRLWGKRTYIIAEAGVNHNGQMDIARRLVDVAVEAGADAVKFQTFKLSGVVSADAPMAEYQKQNVGKSTPMAEMLKSLELSYRQFEELAQYARDAGITFASTPFDVESAAFLEGLGVDFFKIPSGEITNPALVEAVARFRRPTIVSTGMANLGEVERAVGWLNAEGCNDLALLHCVSDYPANPADANLAAMDTLRAAFGLPVGWSDHTLGDTVMIAAVARGACIVEKHFTLDVSLPGPDHRASLDPAELKRMVENIRITESAIGDGRKHPTPRERNVADAARRSIVAAHPLAAGAALKRDDLEFLRPGTGIAPADIRFVLGRKLRHAVPQGALIKLDDLA